MIESALHHLMHDVGVSGQAVGQAPAPGIGTEQAPPPIGYSPASQN